MKNFVIKVMITLGFLSFFKGTSEQFKVHANEGSQKAANRSDTMSGGRSGGCGKSG